LAFLVANTRRKFVVILLKDFVTVSVVHLEISLILSKLICSYPS